MLEKGKVVKKEKTFFKEAGITELINVSSLPSDEKHYL